MALDADSTTVHDNRLHLAKDNMSRKRDKERETEIQRLLEAAVFSRNVLPFNRPAYSMCLYSPASRSAAMGPARLHMPR